MVNDIKNVYGNNISLFRSTEHITYWSGNTTSDFITIFIGTFELEILIILVIFGGIYKNIKKGKFYSLVKKRGQDYKNHHKHIEIR